MLLTGSVVVHAVESRTVLRSGEKKPLVVETSTDTIIATVVSVDYKTREVTLRNSNGEMFTMVAGPENVRLKEIKKKDLIRVDFLESIAIVVQSAHKKSSFVEGNRQVIVRNQTKKPSGEMSETDVVTATVVSINPEKRTVVLRGTAGKKIKVNIASDVPNLDHIKTGDHVNIRMTHTIAIAVNKS